MIAPEELTDKLAEMRALQDKKTLLAQEAKGLNEEIDVLNAELVEYFEAHDLQNIKTKDMGMFYLARLAYPKITDPENVKRWLEEKGDLDLIMSVNAMKFKAYYNERVETNEELPPDVEVFVDTKVRMRRN